jgi:FkbM family methyltransferase
MKNAVHQLFELTPYRLIHRDRLSHLRQRETYRPSSDALGEHLRQIFSAGGIEWVFDVGANDGTYAKFLREQARFEGWIVSFEPLTQKYSLIQKAAQADPKWIVMQCALGATAGKASINIMKADAFSSFRQPSTEFLRKYEQANIVTGTEEVTVRTIADVYPELAKSHGLDRFYLKMDTQGFDLEVFKGAQPVINHIPALQSELSFVPIYEGAPAHRTALAEFEGQGYEMSMLAPVGYDESLRIIEADCVMVHPQRLLNS